jgi:hypothetical protein
MVMLLQELLLHLQATSVPLQPPPLLPCHMQELQRQLLLLRADPPSALKQQRRHYRRHYHRRCCC